MKPTSKKNPRKKPGEKGVSAEVVERLIKARKAAHVSLQDAGSKLRISLTTVYWMEQGRAAMSEEQAEILFKFYAERGCEVAANVAAALGS